MQMDIQKRAFRTTTYPFSLYDKNVSRASLGSYCDLALTQAVVVFVPLQYFVTLLDGSGLTTFR